MLRFWITVIVATALVAGLPEASRSSPSASSTIALPNCVGKPEVRPSSITFACGDGNFYVNHLKWTGWGSTFAAGMGTGSLNDCEPNCAAGHFHQYPMIVIASGTQRCPTGQRAYAKVTYAFVGRSPFNAGAPGAASPTQTFACKPMP